MPKMPEFMLNLVTMINRLPLPHDEWKRLRIAVTYEELEQIRNYFIEDGADHFVHALRGVPLNVELFPKEPAYIYEGLNAKPSP